MPTRVYVVGVGQTGGAALDCSSESAMRLALSLLGVRKASSGPEYDELVEIAGRAALTDAGLAFADIQVEADSRIPIVAMRSPFFLLSRLRSAASATESRRRGIVASTDWAGRASQYSTCVNQQRRHAMRYLQQSANILASFLR
jgi:hypothetical protein